MKPYSSRHTGYVRQVDPVEYGIVHSRVDLPPVARLTRDYGFIKKDKKIKR